MFSQAELDFFRLEGLLSEQELMMRDSVRKFVDQKVRPIISSHYQAGTFPKSLVPEMAEMGLLGPNIKGYGSAEVSDTAYGMIMQELERGDSGIRSFCSVQSSLVIFPIFAFGSEQQKKEWLPKLVAGEAIGCFGLTEPDFGSNPSGMRTTAKRDGGSFVLNGSKMWITNGSISDVAVVWARTDDGHIHGFLVERGTPGFSAPQIEGKLSLRASVTSELIFDNCRIPADNRLPDAKGLRAALMCLNSARFGIAFGSIGAAIGCFEEALDYAKHRIQFDRPIAGFQLIQQELVELYSEIVKAQLLCIRLGQLKDRGTVNPAAISVAKRNNVTMALRAARTCRDILGGSGITDEYSAMRHMCNLESVSTYEGTYNVHTLIVGQALTGISAFQ